MAVEVRQLIVKSSVLPAEEDAAKRPPVRPNLEELKASIVAECKQVVLEALREQRER